MVEYNDEKEEKKEIQIVQGNGKGLDISPAYDYIKLDKNDNVSKKNKKIVIPEKKKKNTK